MALALSLGRTAEACVARAAALGVRPPRTDRRWTEADDAVLRELYGQRTAAAIGKRLSRTAAAVRSRAIVLGVASVNKPWTPEDDERLLELAESQPTARIARELGRSPSTIYGRLKQLAGGVLEARQTLNAEQVGAILGRSSKTVSGWCRSGALKGVREGEGAEWLITTEAVRRFVLRYPNEVHCRRSEREADLVRLLLGRF